MLKQSQDARRKLPALSLIHILIALAVIVIVSLTDKEPSREVQELFDRARSVNI